MNDPVRGCDVYKDIGCAHVDGFLCDYPNCSILKEYKMNNRIKELADEAGFMDSWFSESGDDCEQELKKFAKLIINECARVARETPAPKFHEHLKQQLGHTWDMAAIEAGREIIKHFRGF